MAMVALAHTPHEVQPLNLRVWLGGLAGFAALAVVGLALPVGSLGMRVLVLVIIFHIGAVLLARHDAYLWRAWRVLAPMSVLMVLPDWFLSAQLGTLLFPATGAPFVGTVPLFMAGMWTIALLPIVLVGRLVAQRRGLIRGALSAGLAGFAMFWFAELIAPGIPLWEPVGVAMVAGIAAYVIVPEIVLSAAAFIVVATSGRIDWRATAALVVLLPFTYTGMLATAYQLLG